MVSRFDYWQTISEGWRERAFRPLLTACRYFNITAGHITAFRLVLAILFPFFIISRPVLAWWLMAISIFLDAVDGAVARFQKTDSDRGKFIDVLADQATFALLALGLLRALPDLTLPLAAATIAITFLYVMVSVSENERRPSDWIINPKARLTSYKILFLIVIIGYLLNNWSSKTTALLLWIETVVAAAHFGWHYVRFERKKNLWRE